MANDEREKALRRLLCDKEPDENIEELLRQLARSMVEGVPVKVPSDSPLGEFFATLVETDENRVVPQTFKVEDDALAHAQKIANLVPGSLVVTQDERGDIQQAIFVTMKDYRAMLLLYCPERKHLVEASAPLHLLRVPNATE